MRKLRSLSVFALVALLLNVGQGVVIAQEPPLPETGTPDGIPVDPEIREMARTNAATASESSFSAADEAEEEELRRTIEEWHEGVVQERTGLERPELESDSVDQIEAMNTDVPIGSDRSFLYASEGKNGSSWWGLAGSTTSYDLSERRNNVSATTWGLGSAAGWAWTGRRFTVSGTGSRLCYIDFIGWAGTNLLGGFSGSASWQVVGKVFDASTGTFIGEVTILDGTSTNNQAITDGGNYSHSSLVSLQAGHTYVVYIVTYGDVSQFGQYFSHMQSGTNSLHTRWDRIRLRWQ